jgi:hypothetical protein
MGKTSAGGIHNDLSARYPGRSTAKTAQSAAKKALAEGNEGVSEG